MNKKKLLALLMALVMTLTLVPVTALAEGDNVAKIGDNVYPTLAAAIAAVPDGTPTTIEMIADSAEPEVITIAAGKNITLDLAGHTISATATGDSWHLITNKGTLTIRDTASTGKITADGTVNGGELSTIYNLGGTLNLLSGTIEYTGSYGISYAVCNSSNAWGANDDKHSTFNMTGGALSAPNGDADLRVYQNCAAVSNPDSKNNVSITGGELKSKGIFVDTYLYQNSNTTPIANFSAENIEVKITIGGTAKINGLIDLKLRHSYNTSLTINGGDFTNAKMWVRKVSNEWAADVAEPSAPLVTIFGGKWSFVTGKAFGLAYDCGATSWTSYTKPYSVTGGVFNVNLNDCNGIVFPEGKTGVDNTDEETKDVYRYTVGVEAPAYVAQIVRNNEVVSSHDTLEAAITAAQSGDTVKLLQDVSPDAAIMISKSIIIDGDKHVITSSTNRGFRINNSNVDVTIKDLDITVASVGVEPRAIQIDSNMTGVTLMVDHVTASAQNYTVNIGPGTSNLNVTIKDSTLNGWAAFNAYASNSNYVISGSTLKGVNNFSTSSDNDFATIVFDGGTLAGLPGNAYSSTLTISDSVIIAQENGTNTQNWISFQYGAANNTALVYVTGTTILDSENGADKTAGIFMTGVGNKVTMVLTDAQKTAIEEKNYVVTENGEMYDITLPQPNVYYYWDTGSGQEGTNCYFTAPFTNGWLMNGEYIRLEDNVSFSGNVEFSTNAGAIAQTGGSFTLTLGNYSITKGEYSVILPAGVFATTDKMVDIFSAPEGYKVVETNNNDGTYTYSVAQVVNVAQIGDEQYTTLQAAFDAAGSSATEIVMIADTAEDAVVSAGKNITLNLNGHNIVGAQHAITNNGTLVINDTVGTGCVYTTDLSAQAMHAVLNNETGNLTINAGWFGDKDNEKTNANDVQRGNAVRNWGTATINGGHYTACDNFTNGGYAYAIATGGNNKGGSMTITNADVYGKMNGGIAADSGELVVNGGTFVLTSNNNYRAVWITNNGGNTSVTINDGTFVGKVASLGASIDDNKQDRSDVAISIRGGRFEALDNNAPSVSVSKSNSQYDWTTSITGGKFSTNPSAYVADGYEAVQLTSGEYNGWWQVGIVKTTASASGEIASSPSSINFTVDTAVKESNDVNAGTLAERNDLTVTVSGTTEETTAANAPSVAVAALSNIKDDATLQAIVENAVEKASSKITNNGDNVNVVIQVAKSAPTTEEGKVSYEVHPEAVISVNNVKVGTVDLKNDQIKGTFTFKLNVSSIAHEGDYVRIDHMENNAVLDSKTYRVGEGDCVEITGITRFSIFVGERVDEQNASFTYLGASVRRRVQTSSPRIVVNTCTDMRFGFVVKNYDPFSPNEKYYFQWKKEGGTWSSPVEIINFDHTGGECVASLVITNIPQNFFDTRITAMIYKEGEAGSALTGDEMSVRDVANAIITKYGNGTSQKQWVDYATYLTTQNGSYTVDYDEYDQYVIGYTYTA